MSAPAVMLRLLAPMLVDHSELLGVRHRDPVGYERFWVDVARTLQEEGSPGAASLDVRRIPGTSPPDAGASTRVGGRFNRYQQIDQDSLDRPVEWLEVDLEVAPLESRCPSPAGIEVGAVRCRMYDHAIALLEIDSVVTAPVRAAALPLLQAASIAWVEDLARLVHDLCLEPLLGRVQRVPGADAVLEPRTGSGATSALVAAGPADELGRPLWVTRSLVVPSHHPQADELASRWVRDTGLDALQRDPEGGPLPSQHLIRWLNYLFVLPAASGGLEATFGSEWEALRLAQFFYAALENVDVDLGRVLAVSVADRPQVGLRDLQRLLQRSSNRAQFVEMELADVRKYLTRRVRFEFDQILGGWDFDAAVVAPVEAKGRRCDQRLAELAEQRSARSSFFSDSILLAIGVTSVLGTTIAVADFGRSMAVDPGMAGFDYRRESVLGWFAAQPSDLLLLGSLALSALLAVLYVYLRRGQDS